MKDGVIHYENHSPAKRGIGAGMFTARPDFLASAAAISSLMTSHLIAKRTNRDADLPRLLAGQKAFCSALLHIAPYAATSTRTNVKATSKVVATTTATPVSISCHFSHP